MVNQSSQRQKRDDLEQSRAFIEKAREIGADQTHSGADTLMRELAKMRPAPRKKPDK